MLKTLTVILINILIFAQNKIVDRPRSLGLTQDKLDKEYIEFKLGEAKRDFANRRFKEVLKQLRIIRTGKLYSPEASTLAAETYIELNDPVRAEKIFRVVVDYGLRRTYGITRRKEFNDKINSEQDLENFLSINKKYDPPEYLKTAMLELSRLYLKNKYVVPEKAVPINYLKFCKYFDFRPEQVNFQIADYYFQIKNFKKASINSLRSKELQGYESKLAPEDRTKREKIIGESLVLSGDIDSGVAFFKNLADRNQTNRNIRDFTQEYVTQRSSDYWSISAELGASTNTNFNALDDQTDLSLIQAPFNKESVSLFTKRVSGLYSYNNVGVYAIDLTANAGENTTLSRDNKLLDTRSVNTSVSVRIPNFENGSLSFSYFNYFNFDRDIPSEDFETLSVTNILSAAYAVRKSFGKFTFRIDHDYTDLKDDNIDLDSWTYGVTYRIIETTSTWQPSFAIDFVKPRELDRSHSDAINLSASNFLVFMQKYGFFLSFNYRYTHSSIETNKNQQFTWLNSLSFSPNLTSKLRFTLNHTYTWQDFKGGNEFDGHELAINTIYTF